jgi:ABC-2 type transport system ATP-binding protein
MTTSTFAPAHAVASPVLPNPAGTAPPVTAVPSLVDPAPAPAPPVPTHGGYEDVAGAPTTIRPTQSVGEPLHYELREAGRFRLLACDPPDGVRIVEALGDLETADHIAVVIPGNGHYLSNYFVERGPVAPRARGELLLRTMQELVPDEKVAVVVWLGYDAPPGIAAAFSNAPATTGADDLARLTHHLPRGRHLTVIGHSYGATLAGLASARCLPMDLVALGSPGMGVMRGSELGADTRLWAAQAESDWIRLFPHGRIGRLGLGRSPLHRSFDARRFGTGTIEGHCAYYTEASESLLNVARIATGRYDLVSAPPDPDVREEAVSAPLLEPAIAVTGLSKSFPGRGAVLEGLDLTVEPGTIHGLLGQNGAGKTTTVRILATLSRLDSGTARVAGFDVAGDPQAVRRRIAVAGQYAAVDEVLSGRQNLIMFARLNRMRPGAARRRAAELLERFDLAAAADPAVGTDSRGMRRRLDLAVSLIRSPRVLFLDEPTTGLDPRSRLEVWDAIRELASGGTTVLLTTQYLEEADRLCSRISVLRGGRVVAEGTPSELKSAVGGSRAEIDVPAGTDLHVVARGLTEATGAPVTIDADARRISMPLAPDADALVSLSGAVAQLGLAAADLTIRRPDLDEAFLTLTEDTATEETLR